MLRATAWVTLTIFTNSSLGWADPQLAVSPNSRIPQAAIPERVSSENTIRIPAEFGVVQKSVQYGSGPTVVLLQDMHANEQAQRNAAELLRYLSRHHGLRLIHMEGAEGDLFTNLFHAFPSRRARKKVADYFLKEARLSGAEYAAVVDLPGWTLHGVESEALYQENRDAYLKTKDSQKELAPVMRQFDKILKDLSGHVFPKELALFMAHRRAFDRREKEFTEWVKYVSQTARAHGVSLEYYRQITAMLVTFKLEKEIDFDLALHSVEAMEKNPGAYFDEKQAASFYKALQSYRYRKSPAASYYGFLYRTMRQSGKADGNFLKYLRYMEVYSQLNAGLLDEISSLEKEVRPKLETNSEQKTLAYLFQVLALYEKMFDFRMTKSDAEFFYEHRHDFSAASIRNQLEPLLQHYSFSYGLSDHFEDLDDHLAAAENYYQCALKRDDVLAENTLLNLRQSGEKLTVLVAGGFHTPGLEEKMRQQRVSYMILTPRVQKVDEEHEGKLYEQSMRSENLPLAGELLQSFTAPEPVFAGDPAFQLQSPRMLVPASAFFDALRVLNQNHTSSISATASELTHQALQLPLFTSIENMVEENSIVDLADSFSSIPGTPAETHLFERAFGGFFHAGEDLQLTRGSRAFIFPKTFFKDKQLVAIRVPFRHAEEIDLSSLTGLGKNLFASLDLAGSARYALAWLDNYHLGQLRYRAISKETFLMPSWPNPREMDERVPTVVHIKKRSKVRERYHYGNNSFFAREVIAPGLQPARADVSAVAPVLTRSEVRIHAEVPSGTEVAPKPGVEIAGAPERHPNFDFKSSGLRYLFTLVIFSMLYAWAASGLSAPSVTSVPRLEENIFRETRSSKVIPFDLLQESVKDTILRGRLPKSGSEVEQQLAEAREKVKILEAQEQELSQQSKTLGASFSQLAKENEHWATRRISEERKEVISRRMAEIDQLISELQMPIVKRGEEGRLWVEGPNQEKTQVLQQERRRLASDLRFGDKADEVGNRYEAARQGFIESDEQLETVREGLKNARSAVVAIESKSNGPLLASADPGLVSLALVAQPALEAVPDQAVPQAAEVQPAKAQALQAVASAPTEVAEVSPSVIQNPQTNFGLHFIHAFFAGLLGAFIFKVFDVILSRLMRVPSDQELREIKQAIDELEQKVIRFESAPQTPQALADRMGGDIKKMSEKLGRYDRRLKAYEDRLAKVEEWKAAVQKTLKARVMRWVKSMLDPMQAEMEQRFREQMRRDQTQDAEIAELKQQLATLENRLETHIGDVDIHVSVEDRKTFQSLSDLEIEKRVRAIMEALGNKDAPTHRESMTAVTELTQGEPAAVLDELQVALKGVLDQAPLVDEGVLTSPAAAQLEEVEKLAREAKTQEEALRKETQAGIELIAHGLKNLTRLDEAGQPVPVSLKKVLMSQAPEAMIDSEKGQFKAYPTEITTPDWKNETEGLRTFDLKLDRNEEPILRFAVMPAKIGGKPDLLDGAREIFKFEYQGTFYYIGVYQPGDSLRANQIKVQAAADVGTGVSAGETATAKPSKKHKKRSGRFTLKQNEPMTVQPDEPLLDYRNVILFVRALLEDPDGERYQVSHIWMTDNKPVKVTIFNSKGERSFDLRRTSGAAKRSGVLQELYFSVLKPHEGLKKMFIEWQYKNRPAAVGTSVRLTNIDGEEPETTKKIKIPGTLIQEALKVKQSSEKLLSRRRFSQIGAGGLAAGIVAGVVAHFRGKKAPMAVEAPLEVADAGDRAGIPPGAKAPAPGVPAAQAPAAANVPPAPAVPQVAQRQPAANVQARQAVFLNAGGQPLLAARNDAERSRTLFKLDEGPNRAIRHHPGTSVPGTDGIGLFKDFHQKLAGKKKTIINSQDALAERNLVFNSKEIRGASELQLIRLYTELLGFNLPKAGWYEEWLSNPERESLEKLTPEQRAIIEGRLWTIEDWANEFFVPMMQEMGFLDPALDDYRAFQLVDEQKRKAAARKRFLTGMTKNLWWSMLYYPAHMPDGSHMDRYQLMFSSLRVDSDQLSRNADAWVGIARSRGENPLKDGRGQDNHGEFLLGEMMGFAFDETVAEAVNGWEQQVRQQSNFISKQLMDKNGIVAVAGKFKILTDIKGLVSKTSEYLSQFRFFQQYGSLAPGFVGEQVAQQQEIYLRQQGGIILQNFLTTALRVISATDEAANRTRFMDNHMDIHMRHQLLGNYNLTANEQGDVQLPGFGVDRISEHHLRLANAGRFPFEEPTRGSFRQQAYLEFFAVEDSSQEAARVAALKTAQAFEIVSELLLNADWTQIEKNFTANLNGLAGKGDFLGSTPAVRLEELIFKHMKDRATQRAKDSLIGKKVQSLMTLVRKRMTILSAQGRRFPNFSPDFEKSLAETLFDFYQSPIAQKIGNEELLVEQVVELLDRKAQKDYESTYESELGYFFANRRLDKNWGKDSSILEMSLNGDLELFFGVHKDGIGPGKFKAAEELVAHLSKFETQSHLSPLYQDKFVILLKLIEETKERYAKSKPSEGASYEQRRQKTLIDLQAGNVLPAEPAELEKELLLESQQARLQRLYGELIRLTQGMLTDHYKNDRFALLKEGFYDLIRARTEKRMEMAGYRLRYEGARKEERWETESGTVANEAMVLEFYRQEVQPAYDRARRHYEMRAALREPLEKLLGRKLNLSDGLFRDPAILSKLVSDSLDRNMRVNDVVWILQMAKNLKDNAEYQNLAAQYLMRVDYSEDFFEHNHQQKLPALGWNFPSRRVSEILETDLGWRRRIMITPSNKRVRQTRVLWQERVGGRWQDSSNHDSDAKIQRQISIALDIRRKENKQTEVLLGQVIADAESVLREGGMDRFMPGLKAVVEVLDITERPVAAQETQITQRHEDALKITRDYFNARAHLLERAPIHPDGDRILNRPDGAYVRPLLDASVRDGRWVSDKVARQQKIERDFNNELTQRALLTELLNDHLRPKAQRRYEVNGKSALEEAIQRAREFYPEIYAEGVDLNKILPILPEMDAHVYASDSRMEGLVNGFLLLGFDPDQAKKPGEAGFDAWVKTVLDQSFRDAREIVKRVKSPTGPDERKSLLDLAFDDALQYENWRAVNTTKTEAEKKEIRKVFERDLIFIPNWMGFYLNHWRKHLEAARVAKDKQGGQEQRAQLKLDGQTLAGADMARRIMDVTPQSRRVALVGLLTDTVLASLRSEVRLESQTDENAAIKGRRNFLKTAGLGTLGLAAGAMPAKAEAEEAPAAAVPPAERAPEVLPVPPREDFVTAAQTKAQSAFFDETKLPVGRGGQKRDLGKDGHIATGSGKLDGRGFEVVVIENGVKKNLTAAGQLTLTLGPKGETIVVLEGDRVILRLAGEEKQSMVIHFAELQAEAGRTLSGGRVTKVVIETKADDPAGAGIHLLLEGKDFTGAQHLQIRQVVKHGTAVVTGKSVTGSIKLFNRRAIAAGQRVVPLRLDTIYGGETPKGRAVLHDHVLLNYERKKGDNIQLVQKRVDLKNPDRGEMIEAPSREDERLTAISLERAEDMGIHPDLEKHRSYRVDLLASSGKIHPRIVSRHADIPADLTGMEPNNSVVLGFEENAHAKGFSFDMVFHLEEKLEGPALTRVEQLPKDEEVHEAVAAAITQKFEEYAHHKKRIDKYLSLKQEPDEKEAEFRKKEESVERIFRAAHAFYAALYKNQYQPADHFVNANGTIKALREVNQGLLRGFLYGAAAEIISDDQQALEVWISAAANMTKWFTRQNLDELALHLSKFYGPTKKPFTSDPSLPREEKGIYIAWARFFAGQDSKNRPRWWKGTTAEFFKYAKEIQDSGISETLYGKKEFDINNPQDMGIMINWARFIQKNGRDKFKDALEIIKVAKNEWKQLGEGEVAFFADYVEKIRSDYPNVSLQQIFSNIKKAQKARDKAVDQLLTRWFDLDLYWATEEERNAILTIIRNNLAKQGLTQEKAVYLGSKHMLARAYTEEQLVDEIRQEVFYQAVYMHFQRDGTGSSMMLTDGELGELISRNDRERYGMETVGKLIKFETMYRGLSGALLGQIERGTEIRWTNPQTGVEEVRFQTAALGRSAARDFPTSSPGQVTGFAADMHERELEHRKALEKKGMPKGDIGNTLRYWAQTRFNNTFADMLWLQVEEYQMAGRFLPWSVVSSFLYEVRQEDYNPLNIVEMRRAHEKFKTDYRMNMVLMNLDRPGFDGNLLSFLWFTWKAISGEVLVFPNSAGQLRPGDSRADSERTVLYMENLRAIAKELELQGYSPGQIQGKQVAFLEKVNAVRQQSENLLGMTIDPGKVLDGGIAAIQQKVNKLEENIIDRLRRTVIDNDERYEKARYVTLLYSMANQVLSSGYEARVRAERIQRSRQLKEDLKKPGFRQNLFVRLEKTIQKGDAKADDADHVNFLISRVNILIDKMAIDGLSEDEVLEHYVRLNRSIERDYKKLFRQDEQAELLEDELGVTGYYAGPIARISGIDPDSPVRQQYEAALRDARRKTLESDIRRFKAEEDTNPHAAAWIDELQLELGQIDQMNLESWKKLELERLQVIFTMARHIQNKFKEVNVTLSDKEAQIMAYNAFAGSLRQKNIDDWVAVIKNQVDLWLDTVKELKRANPNLPLEAIMYYADQWLELHLSDPLHVRDAEKKEAEREKARAERVKNLRKKIFELFKSRAEIILNSDEMGRMAEAVEHRGISLSTLAVLIDKGKSMRAEIERIREYEKNKSISDPLKAPQQSYHMSRPLDLKDVLVYLDNLNTNPQVHVGLHSVFEYSRAKLEEIQVPINAAYRLEMLERMRFAIPESIWLGSWGFFDRARHDLFKRGISIDGLAGMTAFLTTAIHLAFKARMDLVRFEATKYVPKSKQKTPSPDFQPEDEQHYEKWTWNYFIFQYQSTYWVHFVVTLLLYTLSYSYFSPLVVTFLGFSSAYLLWPHITLFVLVNVMWYTAILRKTLKLPEKKSANTAAKKIADGHRILTITGLPIFSGNGLKTMAEGSQTSFETAIPDAIKLLSESDDTNFRQSFALPIPLSGKHEALVKAGGLIEKPGMTSAELVKIRDLRKEIREDLLWRRNEVFEYTSKKINEMIPDPRMNASVRARLHIIVRHTGFPKPEIWYEHARFLMEKGSLVTLDELLGDRAHELAANQHYTQSTPRTNPANYLHMGSSPLPSGFNVNEYSEPMSEIMDLTVDGSGYEFPQMAALGADWKTEYPSLATLREQMIEVRERYGFLERRKEARRIRSELDLLEAAVLASGGVATAAQEARARVLLKEQLDLRLKAGKIQMMALHGKIPVPIATFQILDVGNSTSHQDMATLARVIAASPAPMFQPNVAFRMDMARKTLFALIMQATPQSSLYFTIEAMPFLFRDKKVSPFQKFLFAVMFPAFLGLGFMGFGWVGFHIGNILANFVLIWFNVGRAKTDREGDIRPGGKYAVKSIFALDGIIRPYAGAEPGEQKQAGDSHSNKVRWKYTFPQEIGAPIGEDEQNGLETGKAVVLLTEQEAYLRFKLDRKMYPAIEIEGTKVVPYRVFGTQQVPNMTITEDPMFNNIGLLSRLYGKWLPVFDVYMLIVRLLVNFKNQPHWMALYFGTMLGTVLSLFIGGLVMPAAAFIYAVAVVGTFFGLALAPLPKAMRPPLTKYMAYAAVFSLFAGAIGMGSVHLAVIASTITLVAWIFFPLGEKMKKLEAEGELWPDFNMVAGRHFNDLAMRSQLGPLIWLVQLFVTMSATLQPGIIGVMFPFWGELIFLGLMVVLILPNFDGKWKQMMRDKYQGRDTEMDAFDKKLKSWNVSLWVRWPMYGATFLGVTLVYWLEGYLQWIGSTGVYLMNLANDPLEIIIDWVRAIIGVYYRMGLVKENSFTDVVLNKYVYNVLEWGSPRRNAWKIAFLSEGNPLYIVYLWAAKIPLAVGLASLAIVTFGASPHSAIMSIILGIAIFNVIYGIRGRFVDKSDPSYVTRGELLIHAAIAMTILAATWFFAPQLAMMIPSMLISRSSPILIGSFVFGNGVAFLMGMNIIRTKIRNYKNQEVTVGIVPEDRWWTDLAVHAIAVTTSLMALSGSLFILISGWNGVFNSSFLLLFGSFVSGDGGGLMPTILPFSGFEWGLNLPAPFALFFNLVVPGDIVLGVIGIAAGIYQTISLMGKGLWAAISKGDSSGFAAPLSEKERVRNRNALLVALAALTVFLGGLYYKLQSDRDAQIKKAPEVPVPAAVVPVAEKMVFSDPAGNIRVFGAKDDGPDAFNMKLNVRESYSELKILFGKDQFFTLKGNGYLRMVQNNKQVWGTSVLVTPGYWQDGKFQHHLDIQSGNFSFDHETNALIFKGTLVDDHGILGGSIEIRISEPGKASVSLSVQTVKDFIPDLARGAQALQTWARISTNYTDDKVYDASDLRVIRPDGTIAAQIKLKDGEEGRLLSDEDILVEEGWAVEAFNDGTGVRLNRPTARTTLKSFESPEDFLVNGHVAKARPGARDEAGDNDNGAAWGGLLLKREIPAGQKILSVTYEIEALPAGQPGAEAPAPAAPVPAPVELPPARSEVRAAALRWGAGLQSIGNMRMQSGADNLLDERARALGLRLDLVIEAAMMQTAQAKGFVQSTHQRTYYLLEVQPQDWTAGFQSYLGGLSKQLEDQGTRLVLYNADKALNFSARQALYTQMTAWAKAFSADAVRVAPFTEQKWSAEDLVGKVTRDIDMQTQESLRVDLNVNSKTQVLPKDLVLQGAIALARQYGVVIASTNPVMGVTQEITMAEVLGNTLAAFTATATSA